MNLYQKYQENSVPLPVHILLCIFAIAFWLMFGLVALPLLFIFNVFKWAMAVWIFYNGIGTLLASQDVPFMLESEQNKNYSTSLFMLKGKANIKLIRKLFNERVVMNEAHPSYKRLKKLICLKYGRYVWANEEQFDIKKHVYEYEGVLPTNEEELQNLCGEITRKPLPRDISPWEVVLIPMQSEDRFAFISRVHHIVGDGISIVNLFSKVMDGKPVLLKPSEKILKKYKNSALKRVISAFFTGPLSLLTIALSSPYNPFRRTCEGEGEQKIAWTEAICLPKIKEVKNKIGVTINDIVTGCLAGAMRKYIKTTKGEFSEDVQIAVSINTRPPSLLMEENIPLENNATGLIVSLPVTKKTVLDRIKESKKHMDRIKNGSDFVVFRFIFNIVCANSPDFLARIIVNSLNRHCCLIMSNVPGPINKMVIGGSEVDSIMVWPPLMGGTGLSLAVFSYADTLRLNVKADTSMCPNPKIIAEYFQKEMEELFEICSKKDE